MGFTTGIAEAATRPRIKGDSMTANTITIDDLHVSTIEIALTVVYDLQNRVEGEVIISKGDSTSVKRDFTAALAAAEAMVELGGEPCIACYHNHPNGSETPSAEDHISHYQYRDQTEGHGFTWGGGHIVTKNNITQFI